MKNSRYKVTFEIFKLRCLEKFGDICDFSNIDSDTFEYVNKTYDFICKVHNEVIRCTPKHLLLYRKYLCNSCSKEKYTEGNPEKYTKQTVKSENNKFDVTLGFLHNKLKTFDNITIVNECIIYNSINNIDRQKSYFVLNCIYHGDFKITVEQLVRKWILRINQNPCLKCVVKNIGQKLTDFQNKRMNEKFWTEVYRVHGNLYNYDKTDILNRNTKDGKIIVTCPEHGDFLIYPSFHLRGEGCPVCAVKSKSRGLDRLYELLKIHYPTLEIKSEKYCEWLSNKRQHYDIYIPKYDIAIEYNGPQHFEDIDIYYKTDYKNSFEHTRELDLLKYNDSIKHGTLLLYFTFDKKVYEYYTVYYNSFYELCKVIDERIEEFDKKRID